MAYLCSEISRNICQKWVQEPDFVERLYVLLKALSITGNQAVMICTAYAGWQFLNYLLKQARRSVK